MAKKKIASSVQRLENTRPFRAKNAFEQALGSAIALGRWMSRRDEASSKTPSVPLIGIPHSTALLRPAVSRNDDHDTLRIDAFSNESSADVLMGYGT